MSQSLLIQGRELAPSDLEQAAFLTANMIERLLAAALEERPQWLESEAYLSNIETIVMNFLLGRSDAPATI